MPYPAARPAYVHPNGHIPVVRAALSHLYQELGAVHYVKEKKDSVVRVGPRVSREKW
jgi:hypothetical protein